MNQLSQAARCNNNNVALISHEFSTHIRVPRADFVGACVCARERERVPRHKYRVINNRN